MKQVVQGVEKLSARNSIEVVITDEAGKGASDSGKGVRVQIHPELLNSESAILDVYKRQDGSRQVRQVARLIRL